MNLSASTVAVIQIRRSLERRGHGIGIRLGVRTTGCSGMAYTLEFVDDLEPGDEITEIDGICLIVNAQHMPHLQGLLLDYQRDGLNEGFVFNNPNEKGRCGCGESFTT